MNFGCRTLAEVSPEPSRRALEATPVPFDSLTEPVRCLSGLLDKLRVGAIARVTAVMAHDPAMQVVGRSSADVAPGLRWFRGGALAHQGLVRDSIHLFMKWHFPVPGQIPANTDGIASSCPEQRHSGEARRREIRAPFGGRSFNFWPSGLLMRGILSGCSSHQTPRNPGPPGVRVPHPALRSASRVSRNRQGVSRRGRRWVTGLV